MQTARVASTRHATRAVLTQSGPGSRQIHRLAGLRVLRLRPRTHFWHGRCAVRAVLRGLLCAAARPGLLQHMLARHFQPSSGRRVP
eukprot:2047406-Rhodomonas_salina.1